MLKDRNIKGIALLCLCGAILSPSIQARTLTPGHVPGIVKTLKPAGELPAETEMHLAIGLPLNNHGALDALLQDIYDPASPKYHQYITPGEFTKRFGPTEAQYKQVLEFARANHLTVTANHKNRMLVDVIGPASAVQKALSVRLHTYHRPDGSGDFFAPDSEPVVPDELPILDISGLNNYRLPHPRISHITPLEQLASAQPNSGSGSGGTYMGGDFRSAYIPGVALTGAGQAVGLLEFDGFYAADITSYESKAGLPAIPVQTVLLDGYSGTPTTGSQSGNPEVSLDIEMVMSMAPGVTNIISYEAGQAGNPNDILNRMTTDNAARQLACCWAWTGGPSATTDQIFQEMAAQGQSFFCASGDSDAYASGALDSTGNDVTPSDDPYITIVGGTTLTTSGPKGSWVSEKVWNWDDGTGSSGGISSYYSIPSWQQGASMTANNGSTNKRNIPDVAFTADNIFVTYGNGTTGSFGGTSCAAPLWSAFAALVNEQLAAYGKSPLGFANPSIYSIAKSSSYAATFHDITTGNDTNSTVTNNFYATAGYDLCTGWGTPAGSALINALAPIPDPLDILPGTGFSAAGLIGGPFNISSTAFSLTNMGTSTLSWSLVNTSAWLNVSSTSGTLSPGASSPVTVSLNTSANTLSAGTNVAVVWFTNLTTGFVVSREFTLVTSTSLIQNGGFESGSFSSWTESGNTAGVAVTSSTTYAHSGKFGAELGSAKTLGYLSQTLATIPGQRYAVSCWLNNPLSGTPSQFIATWNGTTFFNQTNLPVLVWTNLQYILTATSTSTVIQFGFRNDPNYLGLDDISVTPFNAPSFKSFTKQNSTVQFSLNTTPGLTYQVQYTTNLFNSSWINLGQPFTATNTSTAITDSSAIENQRFYRALASP